MPVRKYRPLIFGVVALAFVGAFWCRGANGQDKNRPKADDDETPVLGASACISCHEQPSNVYKKEKRTDFIRLDESTIWQNQDMHGRAFEALTAPLGKQMSRLLHYDAAKAPQCLSCHSVDLQPTKKPGEKGVADYYTEYGVSCEGCHGFATKWNSPHVSKAWRERDPKYKEDRGQWDMRNPARRAERCTSCHVGNLAEGKFVTHEMYAAGHPPLPALELMAFSNDEPRHYKFSKDLPDLAALAAADPEKSWKLFHFRGPAESQPARQVAVGAIETLRAAVKLLADEAASPSTAVLDLAQFDCAACHHDLEPFSWRQQRGFIGVPGRSQPRPGQAFFARVVAEHAKPGESKALVGLYGALTKSFNDRPFGAKADVKKSADQLVVWCDATLAKLDAVRYNGAAARKLVHTIADAAKAPPADAKDAWVDFDTAQQLIWAVESLRTDLEPADGPIGRALAEAKAKLPPHVRDTTNRDFIAKGLKARFDRAAEFKPEDLYRTMAKVADLTK